MICMKLKFEKRGAEGIEPSSISPIHGSTLRATPFKATFALTQTPHGVSSIQDSSVCLDWPLVAFEQNVSVLDELVYAVLGRYLCGHASV